ncbi:PAS domain-containing protein [Muricoccus nepalensis]|uniref:PAS domain-containing protein n=1 Tax=Muricoccus nepalensis TaxID=1854500 RepID=UPI00112613E4|nr:PAS domain-containing protein [Roseomonas nepalensis]
MSRAAAPAATPAPDGAEKRAATTPSDGRVPPAVATLDEAGRIEDASPGFGAILGADAGDVRGTDLAAWMVLEDGARWAAAFARWRREGGEGFAAECRFQGGAVRARLGATALAGHPVVVAERMAAICFRSVFEAAPGACLVLAPDDFRVLGASDAYLAAAGTTRPAVLGRPVFDLVPGGLPEPLAAALRASLGRVARGGTGEEMPPQRWPAGARGAEPSGERAWSWLNLPVLDEAGRVSCIIHRSEDVTERERDRLRLTQALRLQRVAERTARLGGWEAALGSGLVTWSAEACAILDLAPGHVSTLREALLFVTPESRAGLRATARACIRNGTSFASEFEVATARGWRKWIRLVAEAERDEAGRVATLSGALQNVSERRAAEEANRRLSERLAVRVGSLADAFLTLDGGFRITYANATAREVLGLGPEDPLGRSLLDCAGFGGSGPIGIRLQAAAREQRTARFEEFLRESGRWLDVHASPAEGGMTVTLHDVTERRREREKLRLLEACVARMDDMVVITDAGPDGEGLRIVFVNDAFERRTGHARADVLGRPLAVLQGPRTQAAEVARIRGAVAAGRPVRAEMINHTRAGEAFWVELDLQPVADRGGAITHWVAVSREITERRRIQTRLEEQAALLDQVGDGIVVRRIDGTVSYMNQAAERLHGWRREDWLGRPAARLPPEEAGGGDPVASVLADGAWTGQLVQRRRDGTSLVVEARWTLMRHADGSPRAILAVSTDITARLELEARLRQSQRLEAVGQLTGGVAHDFNNLLTVILGNAEILMESLEAGELREMAEMTMSAAERGAALTSRLLSFSRRQALDPKVVEVNALLSQLGAMLRRTIGEQVELRLRPAPDLWCALIDPPQLESAVLNLCLNARDAMPAGGRVTIATRNLDLDPAEAAAERARGGGDDLAPGRYVVVEVVDTGAGMPPEVVSRAFEPFFTTKEVGQGSGLGLSMVYGFMKQSGGHVSINSVPGLGTAIRLFVPSTHARPAALLAPAEARDAGGWERILLVEDDPLVRDHVAAQLREMGYRVALVGDAAEALGALRGGTFDLLFTDVVMPGGMNGLDLAGEARRLHPGLRVLLTSGYTDSALSRHGAPEPGVRLLRKPYRRRDLADAVRRAIERPRGDAAG